MKNDVIIVNTLWLNTFVNNKNIFRLFIFVNYKKIFSELIIFLDTIEILNLFRSSKLIMGQVINWNVFASMFKLKGLIEWPRTLFGSDSFQFEITTSTIQSYDRSHTFYQ